jgi:hypothetical protein
MKKDPKPYEWDYDGACKPDGTRGWHGMESFSVGVFQWLPKASGKGVKRGKVVKRISGSVNDPAAVYRRAEAFIAEMAPAQPLPGA